MKKNTAETPAELTAAERETIETLVNYPNLERAFAENSNAGAEKTKQKLRERIVEIERVVRRGTQSDADKATRILNAYQTTLDFLEELEQIRRQMSK